MYNVCSRYEKASSAVPVHRFARRCYAAGAGLLSKNRRADSTVDKSAALNKAATHARAKSNVEFEPTSDNASCKFWP